MELEPPQDMYLCLHAMYMAFENKLFIIFYKNGEVEKKQQH